MSIQTQINNLNSSKSAIANIIEEKGVSIPQGVKLSEMPSLISQIEVEQDYPNDSITIVYTSTDYPSNGMSDTISRFWTGLYTRKIKINYILTNFSRNIIPENLFFNFSSSAILSSAKRQLQNLTLFKSCLITDLQKCYNLISLSLLCQTNICQLTTSTALKYTPLYDYSRIAGQWGSIYVPASLLNSYKTATNWTTISSRIVGI